MAAISSASPTAAEPMSLTRPIWGSTARLTRSASFSIAVFRSSTTSTNTTTPMSASRFQASLLTRKASGTATTSATNSWRNASSLRVAAMSPCQVLMVARSSRSMEVRGIRLVRILVMLRPVLDMRVFPSQCGHRRQRLRLGGALGLEQIGEQEREIDRLLGVEPRIAHRVVAVLEIGVGDHTRAAGAFGDVLPGHLQVHAAAVGAFGAVHREEGLHLRQDAIERPCLVAGFRRDGVAVHGIARPHHDLALAFDRADHGGNLIAHLVGTEPHDQRQPARLVLRVEDVDET